MAYIEAFNKMESELTRRMSSQQKPGSALPSYWSGTRDKVLEVLARRQAATSYEVVEATGLDMGRVKSCLRRLHKHGLIYPLEVVPNPRYARARGLYRWTFIPGQEKAIGRLIPKLSRSLAALPAPSTVHQVDGPALTESIKEVARTLPLVLSGLNQLVRVLAASQGAINGKEG